jgi:hypothetical protein
MLLLSHLSEHSKNKLNKLYFGLADGTKLLQEKAMRTIEDKHTFNHKSPLQTHARTHSRTDTTV